MATIPLKQVTLQDILDESTIEGELYEKLEDDKLRCLACGHRCLIFPDKRGICQVRYNVEGTLYVPHGYAPPVCRAIRWKKSLTFTLCPAVTP